MQWYIVNLPTKNGCPRVNFRKFEGMPPMYVTGKLKENIF